jgi:U3 small nucleolar ribonucleoprotein component
MKTEFDKFDTVMKKVLSVSHEELQKRDKEWRRKRARKKRAKSSTAKNREKLIPPPGQS